MIETNQPPETGAAQVKWRPLGAHQRRVAGVLVEKAKTTPEQYPLSINALVTGSNQKSNRDPQMTLDADQVQDALDGLRTAGAVTEVQGGGRVSRFRHLLYDWLGVDKLELAVMAELLLRGPQTEGELRGRAARMEPIADLAALRPVLDSLKAKGLVIPLTPPGRGHIITHALYEPRELERIRARLPDVPADDDEGQAPPAASPGSAGPAAQNRAAAPIAPPAHDVQRQIESLRSELAELRNELQDVVSRGDQLRDEIDQIKQSLGV